MERIKIGTITKPQALKGEFRLKPTLLNLKKYKKIKSMYIDNVSYVVEKVTIRDTFVIIKLKSIDTCEVAETLRQKEVYADIEVEVKDSFDYLGFKVVAGNTTGRIIDINNYGATDVVSVQGNVSFMFPVIDGLIDIIDTNNQVITLNLERFEEVVVYED